MGLDLVVEGAARPGHEDEWRRLIEAYFAGGEIDDQTQARWNEISTPGYMTIGAPRVGHDQAADDWICSIRGAATDEEKAMTVREFSGYYAVALVTCDGVPRYSNAGFYDGVDATSFRGAFLNDCPAVLDNDTLDKAWHSKLPAEAVEFGEKLLAAAAVAEVGKGPKPHTSLLSRLGLSRRPEVRTLAEQLDIVRSAGRWYIFWGNRGHPIKAWF
jgi:hypothetical protein